MFLVPRRKENIEKAAKKVEAEKKAEEKKKMYVSWYRSRCGRAGRGRCCGKGREKPEEGC
jgi:hypothetical protein